MEDSSLGMGHDDPYSESNNYNSQVYVPASSSGQSTVQFLHPYANRPNTLRHLNANHSIESAEYVHKYLWSTNILLLCLSAPTLDKLNLWQKQLLSRFLEVLPDPNTDRTLIQRQNGLTAQYRGELFRFLTEIDSNSSIAHLVVYLIVFVFFLWLPVLNECWLRIVQFPLSPILGRLNR